MTTSSTPEPSRAPLLKKFLPMDRLEAPALKKLSAQSKLITLNKGKPVFTQGKNDPHTIYLIQGALLLKGTNGKKKLIKAGTRETRSPVHNFKPRRCSAWAYLPSRLLLVDSNALDQAITLEQLSSSVGGATGKKAPQKSNGADNEDDAGENTVNWMSLILNAPAFETIPPSNFQALFMRMEEVDLKKNDQIIKQGDKGDYFYMIKSGQCQVTRTADNGKTVPLAILKAGQSFGEEALLKEAPRNANVIAYTDACLMRLAKKDFKELLKEPMINWVSRKEADKLITEGATWLDVRRENEHADTGLEGSQNCPLYLLRLKMKALKKKHKYIAYCDTGARSSAAAFLLTEEGIEVYCLRGGINRQ